MAGRRDRAALALANDRHTPRKRGIQRGIQYAAASRFNHDRLWNTGSPAFAGDDGRIHLRDLAARCVRGLPIRPSPRYQRAQGRPGARCTRDLACKRVEKAHTSIQVQRRQSDLPCAMVYSLFRALPGDRAFLTPSPADKSTDLTPTSGASGPHVFAVRIKRVRQRAVSVHRIPYPVSRPAYRDDREPPLPMERDSDSYNPKFCADQV